MKASCCFAAIVYVNVLLAAFIIMSDDEFAPVFWFTEPVPLPAPRMTETVLVAVYEEQLLCGYCHLEAG